MVDEIRKQASETETGKVVEEKAWSGFYKKSFHERIDLLKALYPDLLLDGASSSTRKHTPIVDSLYCSQGFRMNGVRIESEPICPVPLKQELGRHSPLGDFNGLKGPMDASETSVDAPMSAINYTVSPDWPLRSLDERQANMMIENCVGVYGLPLGLGLNFVINGAPYVLPMVIEEPSVVAAVSGAAKTVAVHGGGFQASGNAQNSIIAQVQLHGIADSDLDKAVCALRREEQRILQLANANIPSMVKRGGGAFAVEVRKVPRSRPFLKTETHWLIVHVEINVCEAMGANCATTVAESVGPTLAELTGGTLGIQIVSNLNVKRTFCSKFAIPLCRLGYKGVAGTELATRIIAANDWARDDPFRCATHNKGIMNGIDAVALATGQDWRAIEAGAHAYASFPPGSAYRPLTDYRIEDDKLVGSIELPLAVGTKGGILATNPINEYTLGLMRFPDVTRLCYILASAGLAQNFAALRALTTEGVQRGHMNLHAGNIAIAAGAPSHLVASCASHMISQQRITFSCAKDYLSEIAQSDGSNKHCKQEGEPLANPAL